MAIPLSSRGFHRYNRDPARTAHRDTLRDLVTPDEYNAIRQSRLNAFYTSPEVTKTMRQGLKDMGAGNLTHLRVLEPSVVPPRARG